MKQMLRSDWSTRTGKILPLVFAALFPREIFVCSVNWPCSSFFFLHFLDQNEVKVNKNAKNQLGQYLVYTFYSHRWLTLFWGNDGLKKTVKQNF